MISKKDILNLLRQDMKEMSSALSSRKMIVFQKVDFDEDGQPEGFEIQVIFQHPNYIYLSRMLYDSDPYGYVREKDEPFGSSDVDRIGNIKNLIIQLEQDGYLVLEKQPCYFYTEYKKTQEYNEKTDSLEEILIDGEQFFSEEEKELLKTSIILTTKGYEKSSFFKEKLYAEPLGVISLVVSLLSLIISFWKN